MAELSLDFARMTFYDYGMSDDNPEDIATLSGDATISLTRADLVRIRDWCSDVLAANASSRTGEQREAVITYWRVVPRSKAEDCYRRSAFYTKAEAEAFIAGIKGKRRYKAVGFNADGKIVQP